MEKGRFAIAGRRVERPVGGAAFRKRLGPPGLEPDGTDGGNGVERIAGERRVGKVRGGIRNGTVGRRAPRVVRFRDADVGMEVAAGAVEELGGGIEAGGEPDRAGAFDLGGAAGHAKHGRALCEVVGVLRARHWGEGEAGFAERGGGLVRRGRFENSEQQGAGHVARGVASRAGLEQGEDRRDAPGGNHGVRIRVACLDGVAVEIGGKVGLQPRGGCDVGCLLRRVKWKRRARASRREGEEGEEEGEAFHCGRGRGQGQWLVVSD